MATSKAQRQRQREQRREKRRCDETTFGGYKYMMEQVPGFDLIEKAVRLREEAEERAKWADPDYREVAELEIQAAKARVDVEIRRAKHET